MNGREVAIMVVAIAMILVSAAALAQPRLCHEWPTLRDFLKEQYGEVPIGGGIVSAETIITVLASPEGRTFSIISIGKHGIACIESTGDDWDPGKLPAEEKES